MNKYRYKDIEIGMKESFDFTVTEEAMERFFLITGDKNPLHTDSDYAKERGYEGRVVYGMLTASLLSALAGVYLPGENSLIHSVEIGFSKPVYVGDRLSVKGEVTDKNDLFSLIDVKAAVTNGSGQKVLRGKMRIGVLENLGER